MTTRKVFDAQLESLKQDVVSMCRLTEFMIKTAVNSLIEQDKQLALSVRAKDRQVDDLEMDIERKCMHLLLTQQPMAKDFRIVSSCLKIITDIERFGDQASDIGDLAATITEQKYIKELTHIPQMGILACEMAHESINSFIRGDMQLADKVIKMDDEVDELFVTIKAELIDLMRKNSENADQAIIFMMITKYLERIGDHAVNVCEWTKYNETGVRKKY